MKRISRYRLSCPLCGKRRDHMHKVADTFQIVSTFLLNLLKFGIVLLALILIAGALAK